MNMNSGKFQALMSQNSEIRNFVGCWVIWFIVFTAEKIGLLAYLPDVILFLLGFVWLFGVGFTAFSGHEAAKYLINNTTSTFYKFGLLFCGVLIPLTLLGTLCLVFTASSPLEVFAYTLESHWKGYTTLEYGLLCNLFVAISFLFLDRASSVLAWANGNLFFFFILSFWPQNDGTAGYLCNGRFLALDEGYTTCNGVAFNAAEMMSFTEYLEVQWGLDTLAHNLASFFQFSAPAIVGLLVLGTVHVLWRKPYSLA